MRRLDPRAALYAGVAGAVVSLALETPLRWWLEGKPQWEAARMAAAMVLGPRVLAPPTFDLAIMAVASVVHAGLSVACAFVLAPLVHRASMRRALVVGTVYGLAVYAVNLHTIAPLWFPWFVKLQGGLTLFSHFVLGATLGGVYVHRRRG